MKRVKVTNNCSCNCNCNQNPKCNSFIGSTGVINFKNDENCVFMFENPRGSNKTAYITRITFSSLSANPMTITVNSLADMEGKLEESTVIVPRNLECLESLDPKCKVVIGENINMIGGWGVATLSLAPYANEGGPIEEAIVLPPGTDRIYEFTSMMKDGCSAVSVTIHWYEE